METGRFCRRRIIYICGLFVGVLLALSLGLRNSSCLAAQQNSKGSSRCPSDVKKVVEHAVIVSQQEGVGDDINSEFQASLNKLSRVAFAHPKCCESAAGLVRACGAARRNGVDAPNGLIRTTCAEGELRNLALNACENDREGLEQCVIHSDDQLLKRIAATRALVLRNSDEPHLRLWRAENMVANRQYKEAVVDLKVVVRMTNHNEEGNRHPEDMVVEQLIAAGRYWDAGSVVAERFQRTNALRYQMCSRFGYVLNGPLVSAPDTKEMVSYLKRHCKSSREMRGLSELVKTDGGKTRARELLESIVSENPIDGYAVHALVLIEMEAGAVDSAMGRIVAYLDAEESGREWCWFFNRMRSLWHAQLRSNSDIWRVLNRKAADISCRDGYELEANDLKSGWYTKYLEDMRGDSRDAVVPSRERK